MGENSCSHHGLLAEVWREERLDQRGKNDPRGWRMHWLLMRLAKVIQKSLSLRSGVRWREFERIQRRMKHIEDWRHSSWVRPITDTRQVWSSWLSELTTLTILTWSHRSWEESEMSNWIVGLSCHTEYSEIIGEKIIKLTATLFFQIPAGGCESSASERFHGSWDG